MTERSERAEFFEKLGRSERKVARLEYELTVTRAKLHAAEQKIARLETERDAR